MRTVGWNPPWRPVRRLLLTAPWIMAALQLAAVARVAYAYATAHAHIPAGFIELHIAAGLNLVVLVGAFAGARTAPSRAWRVPQVLACLTIALLLAAHLADGFAWCSRCGGSQLTQAASLSGVGRRNRAFQPSSGRAAPTAGTTARARSARTKYATRRADAPMLPA